MGSSTTRRASDSKMEEIELSESEEEHGFVVIDCYLC